MRTQHPDAPWLGPEYFENHRKFPPEELLKFAGRYIAWTWDGSRIVAHGADRAEVKRMLATAGIDSQSVVLDYVDPPDVVKPLQ